MCMPVIERLYSLFTYNKLYYEHGILLVLVARRLSTCLGLTYVFAKVMSDRVREQLTPRRDILTVSECKAILVSSVQTSLDRVRLLAVHHLMPVIVWEASPSCGLQIDDEAVQVSVCLRLGFPICKPHTCVCGAIVDKRGLHGLSCMRGIGWLSRHNHINDIMCRAFASAGMPTVKELVLSRVQNFALMAWRWYHSPRANVLRGMSPWSTLLPQATSIIRSM